MTMAAHAGEKAEESGTFHCARCNETVRVKKGEPIPACPNCGGKSYDRRTDEPYNR
jgi:Zn finger protein HypA/HybF involved in hydrogenase expression